MVARAAAVLALVIAACGHDPGNLRVRPAPPPDGSAPLRGGGPPRSPRIASYTIDARLDPVRHRIAGTETLRWTNPGTTAVDRLPFHLYLNAFKNEASLFMRTAGDLLRSDDRPSDAGWGWIELESVRVGGVERLDAVIDPTPDDRDETVVELPLVEPVEPGATIEVELHFVAQLPDVIARTGYQGDFHLVGQWFPKLGVRTGPPGDERWACEPFHAHAEFFADFGTYDVSLTVPSTYLVAATGVLVATRDAPGGIRTFTYRAEDVHDFVWMADPYMEVMSGQAKLEDGTVEVRVVYRPEQKDFARRHLDAAIGAVEQFSAAYLPYPWPILTVVDVPTDALAAGGMEYPTLVTTLGDTVFARPGVRLPEYVTVHEVGHNWFQGILASNEPAEAWLDEGVNEWADAKVMNALYGPRASAIDWLGWQAEIGALRRALTRDPRALPSPIASAAAAFVDGPAYGAASYDAAMRALHTLEHTVGPSAFAAAMRTYARTFAFRHPTGKDLFDTLSRELGQDLTWFFGPAFGEVGGMKLALRTARCTPAHPPRGVFGSGDARKRVSERDAPATGSYACEIVVTNTGVVHAPVALRLTFADGTTQDRRWDDHGERAWHRFSVQSSTPLTEVWIDPGDALWLDDPVTHRFRIEGDGDASLRAAAWFSSVAQTAMQVIGP